MKITVPPVQFEQVVCAGGLDQVTPTLSLKNGVARFALNFECAISGGYTRIAGYERFDGHASPADNSTGQIVSVASFVNVPTVGNSLTASGGATGVLAKIDGLKLGITKITGAFMVGDVLSVGATTIGTIDDLQAGPTTPYENAMYEQAYADIYRADIAAVPGSGPVRGVVLYNDIVYAFRNNTLGTACGIYKSSASGWVDVPLYKTVSFTAGGVVAPADGATLTQGGVTATIKRVVRTSGDWLGSSAAGRFVITTPAGGNFAAGAATIGAVNVTLSGAQTSITLAPGGRYEFDVANFSGQLATTRIYGVDGVNKAFEFDGDVLVPITTGATTDTPTRVAYHRGFLFLAIGSSIMFSAPGLPYDWTALSGAGEIATGDTVTAIISLPGGTDSAALGIFSTRTISVLYGTGTDSFNLVRYEKGTGALARTAHNMAGTIAFDDRGAYTLNAAIKYGNFAQDTVTWRVVPYIDDHIGKCNCATLSRRKSQYRLFFNDGYGLYITIASGKLLGCMPVYFPNQVYCVWEGKKSTGEDVIYFGSDNGFVYQMDKGPSFDGGDIEFNLTFNYASARNARVVKRWRKAALEAGIHGIGSEAYVNFQVGYSLGYDSIEYEQPEYTGKNAYLANARWDQFVWDNFFWDAQGAGPLEVELAGTSENLALSLHGASSYVHSFTINSMIIHYTPRRAMR